LITAVVANAVGLTGLARDLVGFAASVSAGQESDEPIEGPSIVATVTDPVRILADVRTEP
jgi:hypothetical protein